jgi:hypothetical protein
MFGELLEETSAVVIENDISFIDAEFVMGTLSISS